MASSVMAVGAASDVVSHNERENAGLLRRRENEEEKKPTNEGNMVD